jgi:hypothetical protein
MFYLPIGLENWYDSDNQTRLVLGAADTVDKL